MRTRPPASTPSDVRDVRLVLGPSGHILGRAVAVDGRDDELLLGPLGEDPTRRVDLDPGDGRRILGIAEGHPLGDPASNELILVRVRLQLLAAAVRHVGDGLA